MNFPLQVFTTVLIGGAVTLMLTLQPAKPPTEFENYSSANMDYETMSMAGYVMVKDGREAAAHLFNLDGYKEYIANQKTAGQASVIINANKDIDLVQKAIPANQKTPVAKVGKIVGISRNIELEQMDNLWQEFDQQSHLHQQLQSNDYTIYAIYENFDSYFTRANVSVGYLNSNLEGQHFDIPKGELTPILDNGVHQMAEIASAWDNIDYQKPVKAVLERRNFKDGHETVSSFVIYQ